MTGNICEKRAYPRKQVNREVSYLEPDSDQPRRGILEDISQEGACIWVDQQFHPSGQLHLRLDLKTRDDPLEFVATLLRMLPGRKQSLYGYGCSIDKAPELLN